MQVHSLVLLCKTSIVSFQCHVIAHYMYGDEVCMQYSVVTQFDRPASCQYVCYVGSGLGIRLMFNMHRYVPDS